MAKTYGSDIEGNNSRDRVNDIPDNRTLFAIKCTQIPPKSPDFVSKLQNTKAVFNHYRPEHTIFFENTKGAIRKETFHYKSLRDFDQKSLIAQSDFLKEIQREKEQYLDIARKVYTNKELQEVLNNPETKQKFMDTIKSLKKTVRSAHKSSQE